MQEEQPRTQELAEVPAPYGVPAPAWGTLVETRRRNGHQQPNAYHHDGKNVWTMTELLIGPHQECALRCCCMPWVFAYWLGKNIACYLMCYYPHKCLVGDLSKPVCGKLCNELCGGAPIEFRFKPLENMSDAMIRCRGNHSYLDKALKNGCTLYDIGTNTMKYGNTVGLTEQIHHRQELSPRLPSLTLPRIALQPQHFLRSAVLPWELVRNLIFLTVQSGS